MALTTWLIDTSALVRLDESLDGEEWQTRIERGLVRISSMTRLEAGFSARSGDDLRMSWARPPMGPMPVEYLTPPIEDRALEVQAALADAGQHRVPSIADLLVAAIAERTGLTVLHVDKDYDLIAEVTGQPVERLALAA